MQFIFRGPLCTKATGSKWKGGRWGEGEKGFISVYQSPFPAFACTVLILSFGPSIHQFIPFFFFVVFFICQSVRFIYFLPMAFSITFIYIYIFLYLFNFFVYTEIVWVCASEQFEPHARTHTHTHTHARMHACTHLCVHLRKTHTHRHPQMFQ